VRNRKPIRAKTSRTPSSAPSRHPPTYRRAPTLLLYWAGGELIYDNYIVGSQITADPLVFLILDYCHEWRTAATVCAHLGKFKAASVSRALESLCRNGMLHRSDRPLNKRESAIAGWRSWNPAAGFFHFSTKDVQFAEDPITAFRELLRQAKKQPMPQVGKSYPGAQRLKLVGKEAEGNFPKILQERRTWRRFATKNVSAEDLGKLLHLTFGVQSWAKIPGVGRMAMKTSPSGGGLHPIEAYVLARKVEGVPPGIYYYDATKHQLVWLRKGISRAALQRMIANQRWFGDAALLIMMTAVFGRTQWKYDFPRAYRVVLLEAGHLGQTFCLTATWLGLAPFCTAAIADTKWEKLLGIDGIQESVIYAVGAGRRPSDERGAHIGKSANGRLPNWG
jgi:SagB-type dehydrogenase family enzyme